MRHQREQLRLRPDSGLTLIELMTVLVVLAVVTSLSAPGLMSFGQAQTVKGLASDLASDLILARSEALKRNASVTLRPASGGWLDGWTVSAGSLVLGGRGRSSSRAVTLSGTPDNVVFNAYGRIDVPSTAVRVTVTGGSVSRCVELDLSGRTKVRSGSCV